MGKSGSPNEAWARALAARFLDNEPFRWELYDRLLKDTLHGSVNWLDLGAGGSDFITENAAVSHGVAVDLRTPESPAFPFVHADLYALPFRTGSVGALALRFVIEHLERPEDLWRECRRVLVPGGKMLVLTTNRWSPVVALARLVPGVLRGRLISRVYCVRERDVLPTFHHWNSPPRAACAPEGFLTERYEFTEALDWTRRWLFLLLLCLARLTRPRFLRRFRSNILVLYRKSPKAGE